MQSGDGSSVRKPQASRETLKRLLNRKLESGAVSREEATELLWLVETAQTAQDLAALAPRLLAATGVRPPSEAHRERRVSPRRQCSLMLRVLEDGSHGMHFIRDVGLGGVSMYIQAPLPLFPELHCQLPLYHLGKQFSFTARVVWCQPDPPPVVGLEFIEAGDDLMEWLVAFISAGTSADKASE